MSNKKVYREDFFVASLYVFSLLLILYSCTVATTYAFNIFTPHCIYSCEINGEEKSEINKKEKKNWREAHICFQYCTQQHYIEQKPKDVISVHEKEKKYKKLGRERKKMSNKRFLPRILHTKSFERRKCKIRFCSQTSAFSMLCVEYFYTFFFFSILQFNAQSVARIRCDKT